jgi:hypothetical protein
VTAGLALAAAVAGVALLPGVKGQPRETTVAAKPAPELPESFTSGDGTEYHRLTTLTMKAKGSRKASVTVPVSGKPLEVAGLCRGEPDIVTPRITMNGKHTGASLAPCFKKSEMQLQPLIVPEGATEVTVEFDTTVHGLGCTRPRNGGPCVRTTPTWGDWQLAVYEWTPPAQAVDPEPLRAFPGKLGGMKLAETASGLWDRDSSFTLVVESPGGKIGLEQLCAGELGPRMRFTYRIDGKSTGSQSDCGVWKKGPFPMAMGELKVPKGRRVTITGTVAMLGESTNRPVRWSVAAYVK